LRKDSKKKRGRRNPLREGKGEVVGVKECVGRKNSTQEKKDRIENQKFTQTVAGLRKRKRMHINGVRPEGERRSFPCSWKKTEVTRALGKPGDTTCVLPWLEA